MNKNRIIRWQRHGLAMSVLLLPFADAAQALEFLEDHDLSGVSGQSGLVINLESPNAGVSIDELTQTVDTRSMTMKNVSLVGKAAINSTTVGNAPVRFQSTLDVGSNAGGQPAVAYNLQLNSATRLRIDDVTLGASTRSMGTALLESESAQLKLVSLGGLLNASNVGGTYLSGEILNASMFYRQLSAASAPYLVMDGLNLRWDIPKATFGVVSSPDAGLLMATLDRVVTPATPLQDTLLNLELGFDLKYRNPAHGAGAEFVRNDANAAPLMNFAWKGSVKDARLFWSGGGAWAAAGSWNNPATNTTQGLRLSSRWNYVNTAEAAALGDASKDFRWRFGEAGGNKLSIELSDWNNMPTVPYAHSFPMIAMDVIGPNEGPGGAAGRLCWGGAGSVGTGACTGNGQNLTLQAGQVRSFLPGGTNYDAYALMARGGNLLAYSNKVKLVEGSTVRATKDWGLIYTLANLDGNIYYYPGGNPGDTNKGIVADIALMSQTLEGGTQVIKPWSTDINSASHNSRWNHGTHLMIADTTACTRSANPLSCGTGETGMGIGLIGSSVLIMANDTRMWVKPYTYVDASSYYDGGIDLLSPQMRISVSGTFGGGTIPYGRQIVVAGLVGYNAEGLLNMRLSPSPPGDPSSFLGYSMAARLYDIEDNSLYTKDNNLIGSGSGSSVFLAELNRPDKPVVLGGISGDFAITNGKINLVNATETEGPGMNDGYYKLRISNDILFGAQANARLLEGTGGGAFLPGGNAAKPFMINDVTFGGDKLGSIVIPSGQWAYSLTLRPQCVGNSSC